MASDAATDTLTLEYKNGSDAERLSVALDGGCSVPSKTGQPMHAKDIPTGTVLTLFHMGEAHKRDGEKRNVNVAVGVAFVEWHGQAVSEENRQKFYRCGKRGRWLYFRAFAGKTGAAVPAPLQLMIPDR